MTISLAETLDSMYFPGQMMRLPAYNIHVSMFKHAFGQVLFTYNTYSNFS